MRSLVKALLRSVGYDVISYRAGMRALVSELRRRQIELVVDVGANVGQFASSIRNARFSGHIVSFEPNPQCFKVLESRASADHRWSAHCLALSSSSGTASLHLTKNSVFGSILQPTTELSQIDAGSTVLGAVDVRTERLDNIWATHVSSGNARAFLKIDTQGFDDVVLEGAREGLNKSPGVC